ncbi:hypothetical protein IGI04_040707 [Brassica rapa subsp. trilocularis]|uniref:F-box associated domain-containing protein n=1 Tax=Brassica rapa subsp. trilocularis TaxID=1813537 RepID=A0ABQ7KQ06_BRACM|nr:hypothetical protein IGI04_040707 [Brassica rapa subsp. trilocularis]
MAATKMFLIKWYSSSTNLKSFERFWICRFFRSGFDMQVFQIWKTSGTTYLLVEVVLTSWKSSGLHGSLLTKSPFHNRSERFGFSDLEDFWDDLPLSHLEVVWKSSGLLGNLLTKSSGLPGSRLDFLKVVWTSCKVVWTSCKVVWKSSELPKILLTKSSELPESRLNFLKVTTYNSVVHETTEIRLSRLQPDDFQVSRLQPDDFQMMRVRE